MARLAASTEQSMRAGLDQVGERSVCYTMQALGAPPTAACAALRPRRAPARACGRCTGRRRALLQLQLQAAAAAAAGAGGGAARAQPAPPGRRAPSEWDDEGFAAQMEGMADYEGVLCP